MPPKSPGMAPRHHMTPHAPNNHEIGAIKEHPDMADSEVLQDADAKLARLKSSLDQSHRLRLSISANDLIGKSVSCSSFLTGDEGKMGHECLASTLKNQLFVYVYKHHLI